jgi:ABC-type multidrug transport system ATPase subunit
MLRVKEMSLLNGKKISFDLHAGEILEMSGPNGMGKSLALKSLARLIPSSWHELSFEAIGAEEIHIEKWRRMAMYLPSDVIFDPELTVDEFLNEPLKLQQYKNFKITLNPKDYIENFSGQMRLLSSGQKQQIALLRALSLDPKILFLDESFGHMDREKRIFFSGLLKNWCTKQKAILYVSHVSIELEARTFFI